MRSNDEFEARRKSRQREIKRKRRKRNFILFLILCLLAAIILSLTVFFKVNTVKTSGSDIYDSSEIVTAANIKGKNLFLLSEKSLSDSVRLVLPYIDSVKIKRTLPDTVSIKVTDAVPYYCYTVKGKYYIVSQNGYVLEESKSGAPELLHIESKNAKCKIGTMAELTNKREEKLLKELLNEINSEELEVSKVDVSNAAAIKMTIGDRFEVNLGTRDYLHNKIAHLVGMLKSIDPDKKGDIDLSMWTPENSQGSFIKK